ncbi:glycosyltransferase family 4 protein [Winogradskyella ouciana]|uniref:glycosyltransferase family 4 protein n=1 Tax=Winogradskyella ouciana TaxID=2608631 RepID=UPI003D2701CE
MKTVLYIGNYLNNNKTNISTISTTGALLENEGYRLYYASSYNNKIVRMMDMVYTCFKYRKKVDYVLIDTYSTWNFYYAFIISQLCRFLNLSYVPILHGGNLSRRLQSSPIMSKLLFKNAIYNISPSLYLKQKFSEFGYGNVKYIPNTINIGKYTFYNRKFDIPKLLWVRSFSEIYNPKVAIEVLKLLKEVYPSSELCMVGPDSDGSLAKVKTLANKYNVKVKFTGKLKKEQWIELSKDYNTFINTTNFDNMPVSVIEAMALGLPVVSTNVGGLPYLIAHKKEGLLVPPNNAYAMSEAVIKLMKDKNLKENIVNNARKKVEQFNWEAVKPKWKSLLS